jgi:hypothetical protein
MDVSVKSRFTAWPVCFCDRRAGLFVCGNGRGRLGPRRPLSTFPIGLVGIPFSPFPTGKVGIRVRPPSALPLGHEREPTVGRRTA